MNPGKPKPNTSTYEIDIHNLTKTSLSRCISILLRHKVYLLLLWKALRGHRKDRYTSLARHIYFECNVVSSPLTAHNQL